MTPEKLDKIYNAIIVLAIGAAIPPAIGFGTGGWVTKVNAERTANDAVLKARATICVAQFTKDPNYQERINDYVALDSAAKNAFFEKGGWGKMPGEDKAQDAVTQACASKLEALKQK